MSQNRLGKGLEALLGAARAIPLPERDPAKTVHHGVLELAVKQLAPGRYQPRRIMREAELETLADSIRSQGIIQPILVRKTGEDHYEIIAGERRWRAAQMAGLAKVPVVVKEVSDENAMAIALIENIQRENLSALEEALALERLSKEFNLTHQQVAEAVGKSRATISNLLRLLTLTDEVKAYLEQSRLEMGHAKVLLGLQGKAQREAAEVVVNKGLSVRETERLVEHLLQKVSGQNGKGRVIIQYNNLEELDGILAHIQ